MSETQLRFLDCYCVCALARTFSSDNVPCSRRIIVCNALQMCCNSSYTIHIVSSKVMPPIQMPQTSSGLYRRLRCNHNQCDSEVVYRSVHTPRRQFALRTCVIRSTLLSDNEGFYSAGPLPPRLIPAAAASSPYINNNQHRYPMPMVPPLQLSCDRVPITLAPELKGPTSTISGCWDLRPRYARIAGIMWRISKGTPGNVSPQTQLAKFEAKLVLYCGAPGFSGSTCGCALFCDNTDIALNVENVYFPGPPMPALYLHDLRPGRSSAAAGVSCTRAL